MLAALRPADGQGTLSFEELADVYSTFTKICEPEEKARVAFCMYDLDRDCKLDKTDLGNIILRLVFDMPPLLVTVWPKIEPALNAYDYKKDQMALFKPMIDEMVTGMQTQAAPVTLDTTHALCLAHEVNAYVEEMLDEASHDVYLGEGLDERAIHWPEFKKALERNADFDSNFLLPIQSAVPYMTREQVAASRLSFNIVADMPGGSAESAGADGSWIHPMRPTLLADRVSNFAKIRAKAKKAKSGDGDGGGAADLDVDAYTHEKSMWGDFKHWVEVKRDLMKQQDPNPLWRTSLSRMEGSFGQGIGSVFRLYRWFFVMNLYIAAAWLAFVMAPVLLLEYWGMVLPSTEIPFNSTSASAWVSDAYLQTTAAAGLDIRAEFGAGGVSNASAVGSVGAPGVVLRQMGCDERCLDGSGSCTDKFFVDAVSLCGNCSSNDCLGDPDTCCTDASWDWPLRPNGTRVTPSPVRTESGKPWNFDWFYYGGYHWHTEITAPRDPEDRGYMEGYRVDFWYVAVVLGLYIINIVAVVRELASNVMGRVKYALGHPPLNLSLHVR